MPVHPHAREGQPENQEVCAGRLTYMRADFRESGYSFPFDVQWFQIKMRAEQSKQVKMVLSIRTKNKKIRSKRSGRTVNGSANTCAGRLE